MTITRIKQLLQETGSDANKLTIGLKDQRLRWKDSIRTVEVKNIALDDSGNPVGTAQVDTIVIRVILQRDLHGQVLPYWVENLNSPPPLARNEQT